jgi:hypothetical protein
LLEHQPADGSARQLLEAPVAAMSEHNDVRRDPARMLDDSSSGLAIQDIESNLQPGSCREFFGIPQSLPGMAAVRFDIRAGRFPASPDHSDDVHVGLEAAHQLDGKRERLFRLLRPVVRKQYRAEHVASSSRPVDGAAPWFRSQH